MYLWFKSEAYVTASCGIPSCKSINNGVVYKEEPII